MGTADAVSRYVSEFKAKGGDTKINFTALTTKVDSAEKLITIF
jgi:hypothetical protein